MKKFSLVCFSLFLFVFTSCDYNIYGVDILEKAIYLSVSGSQSLTTEFQPFDPKNKTVSWTSADTNIATVDENGKVTAVSSGTTRVKCTPAERKYIFDTCTIIVY